MVSSQDYMVMLHAMLEAHRNNPHMHVGVLLQAAAQLRIVYEIYEMYLSKDMGSKFGLCTCTR